MAPSAPATMTGDSSSPPWEARTAAVLSVVSPGKIGTIASLKTSAKIVR